MTAIPLYLVYIIISIAKGLSVVETNWYWASEGALLFVLIGGAIRSGPVRRATLPPDKQPGFVNPFRRTGLYSRQGLREAFRVARSGPEGPAPTPRDFPQLFAERRSARSFLIGTLLIPIGFVMPLVLGIVFAGTSVKHPTPAWVSLIGLVWIVGLVLVVLPISRFSNRQDSLPAEKKAGTRRSC